jgi:hypothetical protein
MSIPKPTLANAVSVYDGTEHVGFVVEHAGAHLAYDSERNLVGEYGTRSAAIKSIPAGKN